jgi:glycosyltransferase involved in cell wall biosynthesis
MSHVALVIPTIDRIGGAEQQVLLLAHGLARRGWHITVVALSGTGGDAAAALAVDGIDYLSLGMRKGLADPRGWWRYHRWLAQARPDLVHAHLPHATWLVRWSRLFTPGPVVLDTIHTSSTGTAGRKLGYRLSDHHSDLVTAVSTAVAEAYAAEGMVARAHLRVVANGVDTDAWGADATVRTSMRHELRIEDEFVWLAAGRIDQVKDYATMLLALKQITAPVKLLIAGTGPLQTTMRQLAGDLGIEQRVCFLGFQADVRRWMQAADGFVQASLWEGLPMAILEASACGLPVVATDVPGTREAVVHGSTGLLAAARNIEALANSMQRVMQMPESKRRAMGAAGRQLVMENYSLTGALHHWETIYTSLLTRKSESLELAASRPA